MDMNQYLSLFLEEAREHLQAITDRLLDLEREPAELQHVHEIFRSAHTLKGMAATMGFEDMAHLTHEMENVLDRVRNGELAVTPALGDLLFRCLDALETMVANIEEGGDGAGDVADIVRALRAVAEGRMPDEAMGGESGAEREAAADGSGQVSTGGAAEEAAPQAGSGAVVAIGGDFNEYEWTVIQQSREAGMSALIITVWLDPACVLKAARVFLVFRELEALGEVIRSHPSVEDLENEKFDDSFTVVLITDQSAETVRERILNISEIASVDVVPVGEGQARREMAAASALSAPADAPSTPSAAPTSGAVAPGAQAGPSAGSSRSDSAGPRSRKGSGRTIRVDLERLDQLMNLFSELVIDRGRLEQLARELNHPTLLETVEHMSRISSDLQNLVLTMRMVPVENVFNRFPRMVRDLSRELGKRVELVIEGAETELDRTVVDEIGDPLVHLLRNAIDHGLEPVEERRQAGKPETGQVKLSAYHSGNHVIIEVSDDGRGINRDKVLRKALERGLITQREAEGLTDEQVYNLLFMSGFSTAETVTDISGRGVGLDVVRSKIESLGGTVSVQSEPGVGTTFQIQLPLTLSILDALLVQVEAEKYAIPLSSVLEAAIYKPEAVHTARGQPVVDFRGRLVPLVFLKDVFAVPDAGGPKPTDVQVVIVRKGEKMAGLVVDRLIGQQEIVLKSLGKYLPHVFAISGATILGDGQVALILDCNALVK
ncbi:MAG: chemotaxis protein CheA [Calditerricola sp.]|nr:chemotaxis protein CheA [Calditerricola sp.]